MSLSPYLLCALIAAVNALTSLGFSLAALALPGEAQINAAYALSRSLALALAALALLRLRSPPALWALSCVLALMQLGDSVVGVFIHDPLKTFGPLFLAALTFWAAWRLRGAAPHRSERLP